MGKSINWRLSCVLCKNTLIPVSGKMLVYPKPTLWPSSHTLPAVCCNQAKQVQSGSNAWSHITTNISQKTCESRVYHLTMCDIYIGKRPAFIMHLCNLPVYEKKPQTWQLNPFSRKFQGAGANGKWDRNFLSTDPEGSNRTSCLWDITARAQTKVITTWNIKISR